MTVTLTGEKITKTIKACRQLMNSKFAKIESVAQVIGLMVSSFPGVEYGRLHYRSLETAKIEALRYSRGNFKSLMSVNSEMKIDLQWWCDNLTSQ